MLGGVLPARPTPVIVAPTRPVGARGSADLGRRQLAPGPDRDARGRQFGLDRGRTAARRTHFTAEDDAFLQAIANVLGRRRRARAARRARARQRGAASASWPTPRRRYVDDRRRGRRDVRQRGLAALHRRRARTELGDTFAASAHPDDRDDAAARAGDERLPAARASSAASTACATRASGELPLGARGGRAALSGRRVRGLRRAPPPTSTSARSMEEALRESEASFRDLADTAPAMIWTTDEDGLVTFVNEGWLRFTGTHAGGRARQELAARRAPRRRRGGAQRPGTARRRSAAPGSASTACSTTTASTAGSSTAACRATRAGATSGYVGTAIDIHERKTMEGRLLEVYQREHKIAETLQRSLLPERLPQIEGIELAARYLPGGRGAAIGGDWYDVLELPRRPRGARGRRRGRPRPARRGDDGPAPQRLPRLRPGRVLAGRGDGPPQPARDDRRARTPWPPWSTWCSTARPARSRSAQRGPPAAARARRRRRRASSRAGASVPIGAADPAVFREATRRAAARRDAAALHRRAGRAPRRAARASASAQLADGGRRRRRRPRAAVRRGARPACSAPAIPATTWRCWRCARCRRAGRADQPDAARRARFAAPACGGAWRASCTPPAPTRREPYEITLTICEAAGNAIEHAYGPGRRDLRRGGHASPAASSWPPCATRGSWREQARRAPRARPQHHRGADGPCRGVAGGRAAPW